MLLKLPQFVLAIESGFLKKKKRKESEILPAGPASVSPSSGCQGWSAVVTRTPEAGSASPGRGPSLHSQRLVYKNGGVTALISMLWSHLSPGKAVGLRQMLDSNSTYF